jgi:hypothetical protein
MGMTPRPPLHPPLTAAAATTQVPPAPPVPVLASSRCACAPLLRPLPLRPHSRSPPTSVRHRPCCLRPLSSPPYRSPSPDLTCPPLLIKPPPYRPRAGRSTFDVIPAAGRVSPLPPASPLLPFTLVAQQKDGVVTRRVTNTRSIAPAAHRVPPSTAAIPVMLEGRHRAIARVCPSGSSLERWLPDLGPSPPGLTLTCPGGVGSALRTFRRCFRRRPILWWQSQLCPNPVTTGPMQTIEPTSSARATADLVPFSHTPVTVGPEPTVWVGKP